MNSNKPSDLREKFLARLHPGSSASTHEYARLLRRKSTDAEQKLWSLLRNRQLKEKKFRRQHAIANYVADFYCHECKLVIELDGNRHVDEYAQEYDKARSAAFNELGITVLRFWNRELFNNPGKVLKKISDYL